MISKLANAVVKATRTGRSTWTRIWVSARYPGIRWGRSVSLGADVRFSVSGESRILFGDSTSIERLATLVVNNATLAIGATSYIGIGTVIVARQSVTIGDNALIAEYVTIRDQDHVYGTGRPTAESGFVTSPISIGNNVWIGAKATITKGVTIGDNAVIGANAVVTQDIPANCVAAGIPARVIRNFGPA